MPFTEAVEKIGARAPIGSAMMSAEWQDVPVALRERAFFSSQVENARFLQRARDTITDFMTGARETLPDGQTMLKTGSRAAFVEQMRAFALSEGMGPLEEGLAGGLRDITSEKLEVDCGSNPQDRSDLTKLIEACRERDILKRSARIEQLLGRRLAGLAWLTKAGRRRLS